MPVSRERIPITAPGVVWRSMKFKCRHCGRESYRLHRKGRYCSDKCAERGPPLR